MQVLKVKTGYKLVKSIFGKYEEIPNDWDIVNFKKICLGKPEYGANVSAIEKNVSLPRYIRITDLNDDGSLRADEWKSIKEEDAKPYLLQKGDYLFARTGATVGKTYLYRKEDGKCAFAGYLIRFKPNSKILNPEFLFNFTHSGRYWRWLTSIQTWGVQPNVNAEQYSNMPILLPPIREQQKIASILSNTYSLINQTQMEIDQTKQLKMGFMQKFFPKEIISRKKKNNIVSLGDFLYIKGRIGWRGLKKNEYLKDGPYMISGYNLTGKKIDWMNCLHISKFRYDESFEIQLKINDIIMVKDGVTLGRLGFIEDLPGKATINSTLVLIRDTSGEFDPAYLYYFFQSNTFQNKIKSNVAGIAIPHIFQRDIKDLKMVKLSKKKQEIISKSFSIIDNNIQILKDQKSKLEKLKKGLMQKLLTGQIRV